MHREPLIDILSRHAQDFGPVVAFDHTKDKLLLFDFSENNQDITGEILEDTKKFSDYVNQKLNAAGAKFGIGGYNEKREVYNRSKLFSSSDGEQRKIHLGIDIWGKPYTAVRSPLDGIVHSFAFNNNFGDYGATLILTHNLQGSSFHTLFGHLSLNSIKNVREGEYLRKGDVVGEFGIPFENGQWPPHLHFQIIIDMDNWKGDYPGVCLESETEAYLVNCPDPDAILQMMKWASV